MAASGLFASGRKSAEKNTKPKNQKKTSFETGLLPEIK